MILIQLENTRLTNILSCDNLHKFRSRSKKTVIGRRRRVDNGQGRFPQYLGRNNKRRSLSGIKHGSGDILKIITLILLHSVVV